jgi:signal transduction histidine kinase
MRPAARLTEPFMLAKLLPKSLALRAVALSTIWAALSLIVIATVITELYREASERGFSRLLSAHLAVLTAAVLIDEKGRLSGSPDFGENKYVEPDSGWYWSVELIDAAADGGLYSRSLGAKRVDSIDAKEIPFKNEGVNFRRTYTMTGLRGETVEVVEGEFDTGRTILPAGVERSDAGAGAKGYDFKKAGGQTSAARFRVMGNLSELQNEVSQFAGRLYLYLGIFGLGSIAVNALAILAGLNPLRRTGEALKQIREGKSTRLEGEFPPEIAPLANEMNALIDNNRRIVERSRTQVGNLAHALKTPLAVMSNEGQALGGAKGAVIAEQTAAMQDQIQRYLQRARIGAQRESVVYRAPISPIIAPTLRTMQKLNPEKQFHANIPKDELVFAGEADDFQEIIGNVLENAAKWGKKRIELKASKVRSPNGAPMLSVEISDDGRGLTEKQIAGGIKRGKRLDETKPGTGLGLSIVSDTVREYGGAVTLGRSALGGLSVTFTLPLVE